MDQGTININQTRVSPNIKTRFKTIDEVIQTLRKGLTQFPKIVSMKHRRPPRCRLNSSLHLARHHASLLPSHGLYNDNLPINSYIEKEHS